MKKVKYIFGQIDMTWKKVVIFAIITGIYTGLINQVPFLLDTSFRDIAISYEWWVLFAIIIIINCKKPLEAALKTFVFFLISQPLVYLVETPFLGLSIWNYYKFWFVITILTLPGGFVAYFIKKKNIIGTLILSVALIIISMSTSSYIETVINNFPYHILSLLFCISLIIILIINIIPNNKLKILASLISVIFIALFLYFDSSKINNVSVTLPDGTGWSCKLTEVDKSAIDNDDYSLTFTYMLSSVKNNSIVCIDTTEKTITYNVIVNSDKSSVNIIPKE